MNSGSGARSQGSSINVTPQELRARIRAEELRKELLKRSTLVKQASSSSCAAAGTPRSSLPSPARGTCLTPPAPASSPPASSVPESLAQSVGPRNLAGALQNAADDKEE